jgi:membrane-anchored protein YejM (alkaline phosphatase superfamily)
MAENAERFIREDDARPFFLYFCPTDPHRAQKGFANDADYPGVKPIKFNPREIPVPHYLPDQPEVRAELAEYYESIARVDQGVGRLIEALKATNHLDDTLIVFLSDNGPPFPGAKTNLYDAGTRLPLIILVLAIGLRLARTLPVGRSRMYDLRVPIVSGEVKQPSHLMHQTFIGRARANPSMEKVYLDT